MDWSNVLSTIQMIGAGTAAITAAGAGGEKDKEHAAAALSAIQIILQLHAALQPAPARLAGALPDGPASIESPPIPPGAQRMDPPRPAGAVPDKGFTPMDPPAPAKK